MLWAKRTTRALPQTEYKPVPRLLLLEETHRLRNSIFIPVGRESRRTHPLPAVRRLATPIDRTSQANDGMKPTRAT